MTHSLNHHPHIFPYTLLHPPSLLSTHITQLIKSYPHHLIPTHHTNQLIHHTKQTYPILIHQLAPNPLSLPHIQTVLPKLLKHTL
ncbi:FHIPEP family type III secretion protein, partial [Priestia megaterium]|uniref:FHIPEP family type III secretion protein n=1 Tax=Priestia megaterium TaxID=1404 RepID=UPI0037096D92